MENKKPDEKIKKPKDKFAIIWAVVLLLLLLVLASVTYIYSKRIKLPVVGEPGANILEFLQKKQDREMKEKKKYNGKANDTAPPEVISCTFSSLVLDLKKNQYIKITLKLKDESGIYRSNVVFSDGKKDIGFIVKNPNTKESVVTVEYLLDNNVVLAGLKTFKQYEGLKPILKFMIYDNNMILKEFTPKEIVEIWDNQAPDKPKAYWTYAGEQAVDIELYSKDYKNKFVFTKVVDNPFVEGNIVTKYDYGYMDGADKAIQLRVGIQPFAEPKKEVEIEVDRDGKYLFYVKAIDLKGNFSQKEVKFYIDKTPPTLDPFIVGGLEVNISSEMIIQLNAKDNLSGIFRYRIGHTEEAMYSAPWQDYSKDQVGFGAPGDEGIKDVWMQIEDNALNVCKPVMLNYYAKVKKTIDVTSQDNQKSRTMEVDKESYNKNGKINIQNSRER